MKIVMTLLVRDEDDIVADHLSYHLACGVDHMIVTDHGSTDRTREIVQSFVRRGRVTLIDESAPDLRQAAWMTRMARLAAAEHGADWVIGSSADEFWVGEYGDLHGALERVESGVDIVTPNRGNMRPLKEQPGTPRTLRYREAASINADGGVLRSKVIHRARPDVTVGAGNYDVFSPAFSRPTPIAEIITLHYPHRSYEQYARKQRRRAAAPLDEAVLRARYAALPHAEDDDVIEALAAGTLVYDGRVAEALLARRV